MEGVADRLLISAAKRLKSAQRRGFLAEVCDTECDGNPRKAEQRFGWGRETVAKGQREKDPECEAAAPTSRRGRLRSEVRNPQLAIDIRSIVEPHTQIDPELKTSRLYTNLSAAEVRQALRGKGYADEQLPSERTFKACRDMAKMMGGK